MNELLTLHHGEALEVLASLPDQSIDSVVTDPPYSMSFNNQKWDDWESVREFQTWCTKWATQCLRLLKPGGHLLSFGGTRTWHRLTTGIEDAGFEIRDSIAWLHANGYPKSPSSLKPAHEPIVVARKPFSGTAIRNVALYGTGNLNIQECRVPSSREGQARWPANVLLDDGAAILLDEQSGILASGKAATGGHVRGLPSGDNIIYGGGKGLWKDAGSVGELYGDTGGASRFYPTFPAFRYQAKATKAERPEVDGVKHATVKPLALMRWLVRLATPAGGTVLDPFAGSGTTAEACVLEQLHCIAVEREEMYLPLIAARMERLA